MTNEPTRERIEKAKQHAEEYLKMYKGALIDLDRKVAEHGEMFLEGEFEAEHGHITRDLIDDFCANEGIEELQNKSVKEWKEAAVASWDGEWHHTSKNFNKTKHYSLKKAAEYLLKI